MYAQPPSGKPLLTPHPPSPPLNETALKSQLSEGGLREAEAPTQASPQPLAFLPSQHQGAAQAAIKHEQQFKQDFYTSTPPAPRRPDIQLTEAREGFDDAYEDAYEERQLAKSTPKSPLYANGFGGGDEAGDSQVWRGLADRNQPKQVKKVKIYKNGFFFFSGKQPNTYCIPPGLS